MIGPTLLVVAFIWSFLNLLSMFLSGQLDPLTLLLNVPVFLAAPWLLASDERVRRP